MSSQNLRVLFTVLFLFSLGQFALAEGILDLPVKANYQNMEFAEIAADLAKQTSIDVLVDPTITGKVTINLGEASLGTAFDRICSLVGVFYGPVGEKSLVIASSNPKGPYFSAVSVKQLVRINNITIKQLLNLMANDPYLCYISTDSDLNQVVVTGPPPIVEKVIQTIKQYDIEKRQILVRALVFDKSAIDKIESNPNIQFTEGKKDPNGVWTVQYLNNTLGYTNSIHGQIILSLLNYKSKDKLKVLSEPYMTVMDGGTGSVFFGSKIYVPITYVYGGTPVKIDSIDSGTALTFAPKILDGNKIRVQLKTDVSDVIGTGSGGSPIIASRTVDTTVTVLNNETIIVGGLNTLLGYNIESKVPILGDIPLIGQLFKSKRNESRKQEIIIFITPTILPDSDPEAEKLLQDVLEK